MRDTRGEYEGESEGAVALKPRVAWKWTFNVWSGENSGGGSGRKYRPSISEDKVRVCVAQTTIRRKLIKAAGYLQVGAATG